MATFRRALLSSVFLLLQFLSARTEPPEGNQRLTESEKPRVDLFGDALPAEAVARQLAFNWFSIGFHLKGGCPMGEMKRNPFRED
jgi:hypothetical protein